jgi:hypothetical protein
MFRFLQKCHIHNKVIFPDYFLDISLNDIENHNNTVSVLNFIEIACCQRKCWSRYCRLIYLPQLIAQ